MEYNKAILQAADTVDAKDLEIKKMENSFGTSDILTGRGLGLGGFGGYNYGEGAFASPGSNAVRLDRNAQQTEDQADCTRNVLGIGIDRISGEFENATRAREFAALRDGQFQTELRILDRFRDQDREIAANARVAAECCCDLKLEGCKNTAALQAEIKAVEARGIERDRNLLQSELIALRTQIACGCTTGCSTPCSGS